MKEKKAFITGFICLVIITCLCFGFIHFADTMNVSQEPEITEPEIVTRLDLSGAPVSDIEQITELTDLEFLDARGTGLTLEQYDRIHTALPGCEILWDVPFQGKFFPNDRKTMYITSLTDEDVAVLAYFPLLNHIYAEECTDYTQLQMLREQLPDCQVDYELKIDGKAYAETATHLTLAGELVPVLTEMLCYFPQLQSVTLEEPLPAAEELTALEQAYPEISFDWSVTFKDMVLSKAETTTLDLTGIPTTPEEMDALIPYLPNLTYVDMTDCGIDNETMDKLNRRHENVKIVWTVSLGYYFDLKTDFTWFMPGKYEIWVDDEDVYNLRYCTDMIAIDLGHMPVTNCDFCAFMPNLQFLLLGDTEVSDLTPLTGLTSIVHMELFSCPLEDYSPLLTLTGLEDVNLCFTTGDPNIIAQMTWLKNCWWDHGDRSRVSKETQQMLRETLPDCHFVFYCGSSTGAGWRDLPNYFKQRDIFGMYYMTG